ncbi:hypothetical protein BVY03_04115 [bacterium K02(2017)]|nr:hypothetical protein BVY03_04115 [bacterium K02(2017)]
MQLQAMDHLKNTTLRIPSLKSIIWDQNHALALKPLGINVPKKSCLLNVLNFDQKNLGMGVYCTELDQLYFLSIKQEKLKIRLKFLLKEATIKSRKIIAQSIYGYRLCHHQTDLISGLIIECYQENLYLIRSDHSAADLLISTIQDILITEFNAKVILLKNYHSLRQKLNIIMSDSILYGGLSSDSIQILENNNTYLYHSKDNNDLYSCYLRTIRSWVKQLIDQNEVHDVLVQGVLAAECFSQTDMIKIKNQFQVQDVKGKFLDLFELTQIIRRLSKNKNKYNLIILNLAKHKYNKKNKTSFFHYLYNLLILLNEKANLLIYVANWREFKSLLKEVCSKAKYSMHLRYKVQNEPDFRCLNDSSPFQSIHLELTKNSK